VVANGVALDKIAKKERWGQETEKPIGFLGAVSTAPEPPPLDLIRP
jgi:hypothetical protein